MPIVTATPKGQLNGEVVTEFTDTTSTASVTYTYPVQQSAIQIENSGVADIYVTVGTFTNQVVQPNKKWKADVYFSSFAIRSDVNSQEFIAVTFQYDLDTGGGEDSYIRFLTLQGTNRIIPPNGLGYTPPFNVYRDKSGVFTDFDITKYQPTGKTYYVSPTGLDTNDGLTFATAFRTLIKAIGMSDVVCVLVRYGLYDRDTSGAGSTITKSINIKAFGGPVTLSDQAVVTWSVAPTYTSTYQATRSAANAVWDAKTLDANGDYTQLTKQTTIALVDANPGSWYTNGTTVYVRTSDSRVPDSNIRVYLNEPNYLVKPTTPVTVYFEGIAFEGGTSPMQIQHNGGIPTAFFNNCKFKYGSTTNGLTVLGAPTFAVNCESARNYLDGFNYHSGNSVLCQTVEIGCVGRDNGYSGVSNNNGSTTHDGNVIIRINGSYFGNQGPNVADVNSAKVWIVNGEAKDSKALSTDVQNANYQIDGTMWLDSCKSGGGATYDFAAATSGSALYVRNASGMNSLFTSAGASITPY